ncbi:MAG: cyclase family protein [Clostridia bacterium]|nr:cyclase family protein [Clostridia bacterium]
MIIDISQEVLSCKVWPGNPAPQAQRLKSLAQGGSSNLSAFSMCAHNGTHADAPYHFVENGKTIGQLPLETFVGDCFVARHEGDVTADDAGLILHKAKQSGADKRILIAGKATVTAEAAQVFAAAGLWLIGNESQTVGPENAPKQVHLILLGAGVALLEGLVLERVEEGKYFLSAAPLNLGGCEGAPCRAVLVR